MKRLLRLFLSLPAAWVAFAACESDTPTVEPWVWEVPTGFPTPRVPADNPMSAAKVELGRYLFYDKQLSGNGTQACASCHVQARAFTEPRATSLGSTGQAHFRNAMSLTNVAYNATQTWASAVVIHLEQQALLPMFGEDPVELGLAGKEAELVARLGADPRYPAMFAAAFPDEDGRIGVDTIVKALASFERTLLSTRSRYDDFWYRKDPTALTEEELEGFELFFSERLECFHCHGDFNFQASSTHQTTTFDEVVFHNNGLYNLDGRGAYPGRDQGLYNATAKDSDRGRFKAPTLRNIALTSPYMHDGSLATLDEVIDMYAAGGRLIESGPNAGDGRANPNKSTFVKGFTLTAQERKSLLAFLNALTDTAFTTDPRFADPFAAAP
ncbi:MAG: di-heme enzyme [Deltaproteobacteria bacterium]|nr:di-heme enzyme [Deltaproteobacteria bacterium]